MECKICKKPLTNIVEPIYLKLCTEHLIKYYQEKIIRYFEKIGEYKEYIDDIRKEIDKNNK